MTSQPDKLFRDKLESFQRPAPAGAWDRIETNLSKTNKKVISIRVAAGVALLATAAIILWPADQAEQQIVKTEYKNSVEPNTSPDKLADQKEAISNPDKAITPLQSEQTETVRKSTNQIAVQKSAVPVKDSVVMNVTPESKELIAEVVPVAEKKDESKTIVYTVADVNSKFLKKKLLPEATPDNKDASGIQKLIGLAYSAKNSESGLADLRQKKDDLFALSFNKKKSEN